MKKLYIEGDNNPDLRMAFSKLLEQELKDGMPRIVMGDGKSQTIHKFMTAPKEEDEERFLLVDSDAPMENKQMLLDDIKSTHVYKNVVFEVSEENTFFMIQEVEAWILSQPEALKERGIKKGLPLNGIEYISKPSEKLSEIYKQNGKQYHKVREFSKIFKLLRSSELSGYSNEYKQLVERLK